MCAHLQLLLEATFFKLQEASGNKSNVLPESSEDVKQDSACSHSCGAAMHVTVASLQLTSDV